MNIIKEWLKDSRYTGSVSEGCKQCAEGAKLVLLITGFCPAGCFYCPLSFKKGGTDDIYANEWKLSDENDYDTLIKEAMFIDAKGAGITGGDPLAVWRRTISFTKFLKHQFGETFHIHLYTSGLAHPNHITEVINAGVDEIRFHPMPSSWEKMNKNPIKKSIQQAVQSSADVAIEIPAIPGKIKETIALIQWAEKQRINYINLNELEFSERNETVLYQKGFSMKNDLSAAVKQSQETAYSIINDVAKNELNIGIHYCSASFKDAIQLTNRMKRRAHHIAHSFDHISPEGTIIKGIIDHVNKKNVNTLISILTSKQIDTKQYQYNQTKKRLEINPIILEEIAKELSHKGYSCFIIEEYPTADALEVERMPLS